MRQESAPDDERFEPVSVDDGSGPRPPAEGNSRRGLLMGVGLVGVAGVLAACGGSGDSGSTTGGGATAAPGGSAPAGAPAAKSLARTSDIPVGGGKVFKAEKVVVTQPKEGEFHAFSAICTHKGCPVDSVSGGTINCPCHGSKFKIADASVAGGPASDPLPAKKIKVQGGEISLA